MVSISLKLSLNNHIINIPPFLCKNILKLNKQIVTTKNNYQFKHKRIAKTKEAHWFKKSAK